MFTSLLCVAPFIPLAHISNTKSPIHVKTCHLLISVKNVKLKTPTQTKRIKKKKRKNEINKIRCSVPSPNHFTPDCKQTVSLIQRRQASQVTPSPLTENFNERKPSSSGKKIGLSSLVRVEINSSFSDNRHPSK